jgi:hypothetical protein
MPPRRCGARVADEWNFRSLAKAAPQSVIAIENTQYRFRDACIAQRYAIVGQNETAGAGMLQFDRSGDLILGMRYKHVAFRKVA